LADETTAERDADRRTGWEGYPTFNATIELGRVAEEAEEAEGEWGGE